MVDVIEAILHLVVEMKSNSSECDLAAIMTVAGKRQRERKHGVCLLGNYCTSESQVLDHDSTTTQSRPCLGEKELWHSAGDYSTQVRWLRIGILGNIISGLLPHHTIQRGLHPQKQGEALASASL